ncbi:MAG: OadG family transporter subunit [Lawsonibacter sp.]
MFAGMTFAELGWGRALLVALSGLVVVFMMLAILALVIMCISKFVNMMETKKKPAAVASPKKAAPAPVVAPAPAAVDEGELVAVMMAAVAEETGMSPNSFRITNVSAAPAAAAPAAAPAVAPAPAPVAAPAPAPVAAPSAGETAVNSPMPGNVFKVECKPGQSVNAGDVLVVLEAMKMEIEVSAPVSGTVKSVAATVGSAVNTDDRLVTIG